MKYAHTVIGLLVGTALGGSVVAATLEPKSSAMDADAIKQIVRDTITQEPQVIIDSLNAWQEKQRAEQMQSASAVLKDPAIKAAVFDTSNSPFIGAADSSRVVVEFFDYNCPACKVQFEALNQLHKSDAGIKVIFKEYPIFGEQSETNSKIGLAVHRLQPDKYFAWHSKMMSNKGRTDEKTALGYASELGLDAAKVKAEAASEEVAKILTVDRELGGKLRLQGTPSLVVGDELIPHAMSFEELAEKLAQ